MQVDTFVASIASCVCVFFLLSDTLIYNEINACKLVPSIIERRFAAWIVVHLITNKSSDKNNHPGWMIQQNFRQDFIPMITLFQSLMMESAVESDYLKAVELDIIERYNIVLALYHESLRILTDLIKETKNQKKKREFRMKVDKYRERTKFIKILIQAKKAGGKYRDQMKIEAGSIGYGYATVFGRFLDASVTHIHIEDPYIRLFHQCQNLVRFCEVGVQKCQSLSKITLVTTHADPEDRKDQLTRLHELRLSLNARQVIFAFSFSPTLHDRQVKLNNGWIIKIGRGLDYFQHSTGKFTLGSCDLELRPCSETTVDMFYAFNQ